jgi:hypothetical protein
MLWHAQESVISLITNSASLRHANYLALNTCGNFQLFWNQLQTAKRYHQAVWCIMTGAHRVTIYKGNATVRQPLRCSPVNRYHSQVQGSDPAEDGSRKCATRIGPVVKCKAKPYQQPVHEPTTSGDKGADRRMCTDGTNSTAVTAARVAAALPRVRSYCRARQP